RACRMQDDRRIAARAVQVRLRYLQREGGGDGGVERVAATFQHCHAHLAGDPVRAGNDAERAGDLRAGGEHAGFLQSLADALVSSPCSLPASPTTSPISTPRRSCTTPTGGPTACRSCRPPLMRCRPAWNG